MANIDVTNLSAITDRVRRGQFVDALALLDRPFPRKGDRDNSASVALLRAELWERIGRTQEAWQASQALEKSARLEEAHAVRLLLLKGSLERHRGHRAEAARAYEGAALAATAAGEHQLHWWARLRLLALGEATALDALAPVGFNRAERAISRIGDPEIAIAFHILCAEYYAKAGWFSDSEDQTAVAESLLTSFPNVWLTGLARLHRGCLSYLQGNFESAQRDALTALSVAQESGHHQSKCSALVNLGAAYLAMGQSLRAESVLMLARQVSHTGTTPHALAVETLAETWLTIRSLTDCAGLLDAVSREMEEGSLTLSAWHADWSLSTRVRLRQLLSPSAHPLDASGGSRLRPRSSEDSPVAQRLRLLEAAGYLRSGQRDEASSVLTGITRSSHRAPPSVLGQVVALAARLQQEIGCLGRSIAAHRLALLILSTAGDTADLVDCVTDYARLIWSSAESVRGACSTNWSCRNLHRPVHITSLLDAATRLGEDHTHGYGGVSELIMVAWQREHHPALVGELAVRYLVWHDYVESAHLLESRGGNERVVVAHGRRVPSAGRSDRTVVEFEIGTKDGAVFKVVLTLRDSLEAAQNGQTVAFILRSRILHERDGSMSAIAEPSLPVVSSSGAVFSAPSMISLLSLSRRAAVVDGNVLITGESGTGKEVLARHIHESSPRAALPFVAVNCSAMPKDLVDSQLFGHRRGAYTGATEASEGLIRSAAGGTLFLDEVADIPLDVQPKLLRFLDSKEVHPLGEPRPTTVDVRIVAATNAEPEQLVAAGRFRQDLFYRLNTFRFRIPPLRERREDIETMVDTFFEDSRRRLNRKGVSLSKIARAHLIHYDWPGNVRQLQGEILRLVALSDEHATIGVAELSSEIVAARAPRVLETDAGDHPRIDLRLPLPTLLRSVEVLAVQRAVEESLGNQSEAARRLGVTRKGLYLMRQRLGC